MGGAGKEWGSQGSRREILKSKSLFPLVNRGEVHLSLCALLSYSSEEAVAAVAKVEPQDNP